MLSALISLISLLGASSACELAWVRSSGVQAVPNAINVLDGTANILGTYAYFARQGNQYGYVRQEQQGMIGAFLCKCAVTAAAGSIDNCCFLVFVSSRRGRQRTTVHVQRAQLRGADQPEQLPGRVA